jgi:hypothetical protein
VAWVFNKTLWVASSAPYLTAAQLNRIEAGIDAAGKAAVPPLVTTPATLAALGAVDGQECYFLSAAMDAAWHLRYRLATGKWEFVGGASLYSGPAGNLSTASASLAALTGGPTVTVPLTGRYNVYIEAFIQQTAGGVSQSNIWWGRNGAYVAAAGAVSTVGQAQWDGVTVSGRRLLDLVAGDVVSIMCTSGNGVQVSFSAGVIDTSPRWTG